jgi:hypothetical protein
MNASTTRRLSLGGTALGVLLFGGLFFGTCDLQGVHFVNALEVPVDVLVDGSRALSLEPGVHKERSFTSGPHHIEVKTRDGRSVEQADLFVHTGESRAVVWNVLGAAPLYLQTHLYARSGGLGRSNGPPTVTHYAGTRLVDQPNVEYVFTSAPSSISTKDKSGRAITRLSLNLAEGGWRTSARLLEDQRKFAELAGVAEGILQVEPRSEEALTAALTGWYHAHGPEAALSFLRRVRDAQPDWFTPTERTVHLSLVLGQREALRQSLAANAEKVPEGDVTLAFLAKVEPPEAGRARLEAVLAKNPEDAFFQAEVARLRFVTGRYDEAVALNDKRFGPGRPVDEGALSAHLRSMVALGLASDALKLAAQVGDKAPTVSWRFAVLYGQLASFVPKEQWPRPVQHFVEKANGNRTDRGLRLWMKALLGEELSATELRDVPDEDVRKALTLIRAAWSDPELAWKECRNASPRALAMLDTTTALLLAAEFERAGDAALAGQLFGALALEVPLSRAELRRAVFEPEGLALLAHLDPEWRAAVTLARARRLDALGEDSREVYAQVLADDLLQAQVTSALRRWNRVQRRADGEEEGVYRLVRQTPKGAVSDGAPR